MIQDLAEAPSVVVDSSFHNQRELLNGLNKELTQGANTPVFFAGSQPDFEIFSKVQTYQNFQPNPIDWNGSDDDWGQVLRESQSLICSQYEKQIEQILDSFRSWQDSDWCSSNLPEIYRASTAGHVKSLLVSTEFNCFGCRPCKHEFDFATSSQTQRDHEDEDIVNLLISKTIRAGGRAFCVPSHLMPEGADTVALFGGFK